MRRLYRHVLAFFRLDLDAVCDLSLQMGPYDYHDFDDDFLGEPCHFVYLQCRRCGKLFMM